MEPTFARAFDELEDLFRPKRSIGLQAFDFTGGGSHVIWDEARIHRAHMAPRHPNFRLSVQRDERLHQTFAVLPFGVRVTLAEGFKTWGTVHPTLCEALMHTRTGTTKKLCMLQIALRCPAGDALITRAWPKGNALPLTRLEAFEAIALRDVRNSVQRFSKLKSQAWKWMLHAVEAYDAVMSARATVEAQAEREDDREMEARLTALALRRRERRLALGLGASAS